MAYNLPNGSTFDLAQTYTPFFTISNITRANGSVTITATGHTFTVGQVVMIKSSWDGVDGKTLVVQSISGSTFTVNGVDTTDTRKNPSGLQLGTCRGVLTWIQIPQILDVAFSGGDQQSTNIAFVNSAREISLPTRRSAATMTLTLADDSAGAYFNTLAAADKSKELHVQRINLADKTKLYYTTYVSLNKNIGITRNQIMTREVVFSLYNDVTRV